MMTDLQAITGGEITSLLGHFWWPFLRITAFLWALPMFGDRLENVRVRILLGFFLAVLVAPMTPEMPEIEPFSLSAVIISAQQITLGFLMGFSIAILMSILALLGQILSLQMGLAMGVMNDPSSGSIPLIGQLFVILGSLLFLSMNGHLIALDVVVESFFTWPVGSAFSDLRIERIIALAGWMFGSALLLAMPAVVAMLIVNITFGVMNRSAPSLNVIALGFPMSMMMGLLSAFLTISGIPGKYSEFTSEVINQMRFIISGV